MVGTSNFVKAKLVDSKGTIDVTATPEILRALRVRGSPIDNRRNRTRASFVYTRVYSWIESSFFLRFSFFSPAPPPSIEWPRASDVI